MHRFVLGVVLLLAAAFAACDGDPSAPAGGGAATSDAGSLYADGGAGPSTTTTPSDAGGTSSGSDVDAADGAGPDPAAAFAGTWNIPTLTETVYTYNQYGDFKSSSPCRSTTIEITYADGRLTLGQRQFVCGDLDAGTPVVKAAVALRVDAPGRLVSSSTSKSTMVTIATSPDGGTITFSESTGRCVNTTPYGCDNQGGSTSTVEGAMVRP